jgi:hypothetical protein
LRKTPQQKAKKQKSKKARKEKKSPKEDAFRRGAHAE